MKRFLCVLLCLGTLFSLCACRGKDFQDTVSFDEIPYEVEKEIEDAVQRVPHIFIVGDSTAEWSQENNKNLMGWGYYFPRYLQADVKTTVLAKSGESSLSFLALRQYETLINEVQEGDIVLIQFGHNDMDSDSDHTDPHIPSTETDASGLNEQGVYSFRSILYNCYIRPMQARGATPVLLSPITRRADDGRPEPGQLVDYATAMEALAAEFDVAYVDAQQITIDLYNSRFEAGGADATAQLHAYLDEQHTAYDRTHLSHLGAYTVAGLIADALKETLPDIVPFCLETPVAMDS